MGHKRKVRRYGTMFEWLKLKDGADEQVAVADHPEPRYRDKYLVCKTCTTGFLFSAGEQEYFASVPPEKGGPLSEPKRCPECRLARRLAIGKGGNGNGNGSHTD